MSATRRGKPIKSGFTFVCYLSIFQQRSMVAVVLMGKPVAVFKREDGTFFAREMACKHQGADLTKGPIIDGIVTCPRHGWQYDLKTGECLSRDYPPLREHTVAVKGDAVFVSLFPQPYSV